ncbi:site-2 protease family protein [Polyangium aurulentum]|uniref:site-2 protease family protein n=1 Tax=Polyangium aurulentum TaxID=2567896 RepID=UPI0010AEBC82|nr:site-2 protease family protein [Polyangium aurulentum]UQA62439.1 site-2 protease family protein [Polyangium aurulentum]
MLERGWTIFRIRGIPVRLHITLLLFLPYAAFVASAQFRAIARAVGLDLGEIRLPLIAWGAILAVGLFVSILLHELAHCAVALQNGVGVRSITLMMLGGVSRMEKDVRPDREAWMAFAGPLSSFGIAVACYGLSLVPFPDEVRVALLVLAMVNGVLGIFNLLPAFPMDGGRVLRGLLTGPLGPDRATRVASTVGKVMAVGFGLYGLVTFNVILVFIAAFVYMGAAGERNRVEVRHVLEGMPVTQVMTDRLGEASVDERAGEVARRLLRNNLVGALVVDGLPHDDYDLHEHVVGVVTAYDLARPGIHDEAVTVGSAMRKDMPRVHTQDDAATTLDALTSGGADAVIVLDNQEHVVGVVTPADLQRAMMLVGAAGGNGPAARRS